MSELASMWEKNLEGRPQWSHLPHGRIDRTAKEYGKCSWCLVFHRDSCCIHRVLTVTTRNCGFWLKRRSSGKKWQDKSSRSAFTPLTNDGRRDRVSGQCYVKWRHLRLGHLPEVQLRDQGLHPQPSNSREKFEPSDRRVRQVEWDQT